MRRSWAGAIHACAMLVLVRPGLASRDTPIEGDLELLRLIAYGYRDNLAKLQTWRGEAAIEHRFTSGSAGDRVTKKSQGAFVHSREMDATRWDWRTTSFQVVEGGEVKERPAYCTGGMLKGEKLFVVHRTAWPRGDAPLRLDIKPRPKDPDEVSGWEDSLNPLFFFVAVDRDLPGMLLWYHGFGKNPMVFPTTIKRSGEQVVLETTAEGVVNRYTFDLSQGCNLVSYYARSAGVEAAWDFGFELAGGVFVPVRVVFREKRTDDSGAETSTREKSIRFTTNQVNVPVAADEFSVGRFGLRAGDQVYDEIVDLWFDFVPEARLDGTLPAAWDLKPVPVVQATQPSGAPEVSASGPSIQHSRTTDPGRPGGEARRNVLAVLAGAGLAGVLLLAAAVLIRRSRRGGS